MSEVETRDWRPTPERILWLAAALTLVLLPHAARIPLWTTLTFGLLMLWRVACITRGLRLPGRWLRLALSLGLLGAVFAGFGTVLGRDAGVALLVVLTGMKFLEARALRDAQVLCALGYFLAVTNFLYSQSIPMGLYMVPVVVLLTGALVTMNTAPEELRPLERVRVAGRLLLHSLPIMLALFLLFPRVSGPLWGLPKDAYGAGTGLTDSMSPGSISQVSLSDAVAFRVKFDGRPPPPTLLYWRGPVLWHTNGRTWSAGRAQLLDHPPRDRHDGEPVDYTVTLEPHQKRWLFALDAPASVPHDSRMSADLQLLARKPVRERVQYRVRSYLRYRDTVLEPGDLRRALQLPPGAHPRARALAARWRAESPDPGAVVQRALDYFASEPFYYTLHPPLLDGDTVDQFLFRSRRGFCEHYAAAFAVLMRAAGIPARVVTGYQGGEMNPLGDYLIVRQRDAHAWTEVWMPPRGWVRVDPTAAVSPARIERGMEATMPSPIGVAGIELPSNGTMRTIWLGLRRAWDSANNSWNQWVLGYGPRRQHRFLSHFGLDAGDWRQLAAGLLVGVSLLLLAVAGWILRRREPGDAVLRAYRRFCAKLARRGLGRRESEGPVDYARRVSAGEPRIAGEVGRITALYVRLRYGAGDADARELQRAVAEFRP